MILGKDTHTMRLDMKLQKDLSMAVYSGSRQKIKPIYRAKINKLIINNFLENLSGSINNLIY